MSTHTNLFSFLSISIPTSLLSFHGYTTPYKPSLPQLIACESIAACVSSRAIADGQKEQTTRLLSMGNMFRNWNNATGAMENLQALGDEILSVMKADVLAARIKGEKTVWSVAKGNMSLLPRGLFWNKMTQHVPDYSVCIRSAKKSSQEFGLSDINCPGSDFCYIHGKDVEIMLGRAYRQRDVVWAGDPDAPKVNIGGLLHPRASFEAQIEKARRDPRPFDELDQRLAELLRDLIFRKESPSWAMDLLHNNDGKHTDIFRTFDALEDTKDESAGSKILGKSIRFFCILRVRDAGGTTIVQSLSLIHTAVYTQPT